ncbi:hypothetical protein CsSME_00022564 [Camellia sinensis var. sinensis]
MNPSTPTPPPPPPPPPPPVSAPPSAQLQMQSSQNPSQNANNDEKIANRAMSNFRALVMKFVTSDTTIPLTPSRKTLMQNRLTHLFPDTHTPDHPTYASMIHGAIKELNEEGGSSEESISKFIKNKHDDLPWAHSTFLKHHLWKLCESGDIAVTYEKRYLLGGAITKLSTNQRTCATPKREQLKTKQRKVRGKRRGRQHKKYVSEEEEETEEETKEETEEEMEEEEEDETEEDEEEEKKMEMEMVDIEIQSGDDASPKREQLKTKQKVRGRPRKKDVIGEEEMEMIDIEILSKEQNKAIEEQNQLTEERDEVFDNQPKDEEPGCSDIGRPAETPLDIAFETIGESSMADQQHKNEWKQPQRRGRGRPPMCKSSAGRNVENSQKQLQQKRRGRGRPRKLDSGIQGQ